MTVFSKSIDRNGNFETWFDDEGKLIRKVTFDAEPVIESVKARKSDGAPSDKWHVGRIPVALMDQWRREAGLRPDQLDELREVVRKKLISGEFNKLRPHEGSY